VEGRLGRNFLLYRIDNLARELTLAAISNSTHAQSVLLHSGHLYYQHTRACLRRLYTAANGSFVLAPTPLARANAHGASLMDFTPDARLSPQGPREQRDRYELLSIASPPPQ
jgi:hypothetical protein